MDQHEQWREQLKALTKLEKPSSRTDGSQTSSKSGCSTQMPKATKVPRALQMHLHKKDKTGRSKSRELPECLDTFSDFYNPRVSTNKKFDKYLREMERRDQKQTWHSTDTAKGSKIRREWLHKCPELVASYSPGSKGGGWKVIPHIQVNRHHFQSPSRAYIKGASSTWCTGSAMTVIFHIEIHVE